MYQVHPATEIAEVQGLLDRCVSAADNSHLFAAVEKAVAGRAGADALAHESFLTGQAKVLGRGPGRYDQGIAAVVLCAAQTERLTLQVNPFDMVKNNRRVKTLNVCLHLHH